MVLIEGRFLLFPRGVFGRGGVKVLGIFAEAAGVGTELHIVDDSAGLQKDGRGLLRSGCSWLHDFNVLEAEAVEQGGDGGAGVLAGGVEDAVAEGVLLELRPGRGRGSRTRGSGRRR